MNRQGLSWFGIIRLGLVQTALGAIVVLTTSTINRVMVVELALPALLPGMLIALHHATQALRPRWGHGSDVGARHTPWIIGGMALLALGGAGAALATAIMAQNFATGLLVAIAAFMAIGIGVGAAGTSLLVLLAKRCAPERRAAAATIVWIMMIAGFVLTTVGAGKLLTPFSMARMVEVAGGICTLAFAVSLVAIWGIEGRGPVATVLSRPNLPFGEALAEVWREPEARRLTIFVFVSMLAYFSEELILDPFSGAVFGFSPGESTKLSGVLHSGVLIGMVVLALAASGPFRHRIGSLRLWMVAGCIGSALSLASLAMAGIVGPGWPLQASVFALGFANGTFSMAAISTMMTLAGAGQAGREGVRMGLWGAAQGIAAGAGGLVGAGASDLARIIMPTPGLAYAGVFAGEAVLFIIAASIATGFADASARNSARNSIRKPDGHPTGHSTGHSAGAASPQLARGKP